MPRWRKPCVPLPPTVGQRVRVHYAKATAPQMPYHGRTGVVRIVATGRGPRNVGVEIDGVIIVIPRGNLVAMPQKDLDADVEVKREQF